MNIKEGAPRENGLGRRELIAQCEFGRLIEISLKHKGSQATKGQTHQQLSNPFLILHAIHIHSMSISILLSKLTRLQITPGLSSKNRQVDVCFATVDYGVGVFARPLCCWPVSHDHLRTDPIDYSTNPSASPGSSTPSLISNDIQDRVCTRVRGTRVTSRHFNDTLGQVFQASCSVSQVPENDQNSRSEFQPVEPIILPIIENLPVSKVVANGS